MWKFTSIFTVALLATVVVCSEITIESVSLSNSAVSYSKVPLALPSKEVPLLSASSDNLVTRQEEEQEDADVVDCFTIKRSSIDEDVKVAKVDLCVKALETTKCINLWTRSGYKNLLGKLTVSSSSSSFGEGKGKKRALEVPESADFCISSLGDEIARISATLPPHPWMALSDLAYRMYSTTFKQALIELKGENSTTVNVTYDLRVISQSKGPDGKFGKGTQSVFKLNDLIPAEMQYAYAPYAQFPVDPQNEDQKTRELIQRHEEDDHHDDDEDHTIVSESYPLWLFIISIVALVLIAGGILLALVLVPSKVTRTHSGIVHL